MKLITRQHCQPRGRSQTGAALAISLIMLLLLTIIGVTAMQTTTMQERMAGNARERNNAFQIAEAALLVGERFIASGAGLALVDPGSSSANGQYFENTAADNDWYLTKMSADSSSVRDYIVDPSYGYGYVIEQLDAVADESLLADSSSPQRFYRITTRGTGPAGTGIVLLQSIYKQ